MSKQDAIDKAIETTKLVRSLTKDDPNMQDTEWNLEFSPECFSDTPVEFAVEICEAVKSLGTNSGKPNDLQFACHS